jgi:prefoldin alpha subunit
MERDLARLIVEQRRILEEIERVYSEISLLERAILERQLALTSLNEYKNIKEERDTLVPIGGNIYIPSRLIPGKKLLVGVGANVYIAKSVDDAIAFINESLGQLNRLYRDRVNTLNQLRRRYDEDTALIAEIRMKQQQQVSGK